MFEGGVDDELAIDAGHAHFSNVVLDGHIAHCDGCRGGQTCQSIGLIGAVAREEQDVHKSIGVKVRGEQGAEHAVNEAGSENLVVVGAAFTLGETARVTAKGRIFFFVFNLKRHEVGPFFGFLCRNHCGEQHGVAHSQFNSSIGLLGKLSSFEGDFATITQHDGFFSRCKHKLVK